jgi:hypothetical protein
MPARRLIKICYGEGKALGSEESKSLGCGLCGR